MNCYLTHKPQRNGGGSGGGNVLSNRMLTIRRWAAIGDSLSATVVADRLIEMGFEVRWITHPANHCVIRRHRRISEVTDQGYADVDLDNAYERNPMRRSKHFSSMWFEAANAQLARYGISIGAPLNCHPSLALKANDKAATRASLAQYDRPWVMVCPRSDSYAVRQVPDGIWESAAAGMQGTKFWLGRHPAPKNFIDLKCQHLDRVINYIAVADLMVSVDTGPLHLAAALGVPLVGIDQSSSPNLHLGDQVDFSTVGPDLHCLNCQANICPINQWTPPCQNVDPALIAREANRKLQYLTTENVSACIAVYRPEASVLNRCLDCLLPQVQEVVIASEGNSILPPGINRDSKIRFVTNPERRIGYSRNINRAVRNSSGKYLLIMNDDVFLKPDAVARMMEALRATDGVGIVSNLLRYGDNSIYYSGKVRSPGVRGWAHANHRQHHPYFSEVSEIENACGCVNLVPRKVFYEVGGFDEEFFLFSQDDAFSLSVRRAGYKILFTPHSEGTHLEHQSVSKVGEIGELLKFDNAVFHRKWGGYLEHNLNRIPGVFDY